MFDNLSDHWQWGLSFSYASLLSFIIVCIPVVQKFLSGFEPLVRRVCPIFTPSSISHLYLSVGLSDHGPAADWSLQVMPPCHLHWWFWVSYVTLSLDFGDLRFFFRVLICPVTYESGAYCHTARPPPSESEKASDLERFNEVESKSSESLKAQAPTPSSSTSATIIIGIIARQVAAPLIMIPILFLIRRAIHTTAANASGSSSSDIPGNVIKDPCFLLVMVLLIGAPPAITLAQMSSVNKFPVGSLAHEHQKCQSLRFEHLVSKTLLTSYTIVTPISTVLLVLVAVVIVQKGSWRRDSMYPLWHCIHHCSKKPTISKDHPCILNTFTW